MPFLVYVGHVIVATIDLILNMVGKSVDGVSLIGWQLSLYPPRDSAGRPAGCAGPTCIVPHTGLYHLLHLPLYHISFHITYYMTNYSNTHLIVLLSIVYDCTHHWTHPLGPICEHGWEIDGWVFLTRSSFCGLAASYLFTRF